MPDRKTNFTDTELYDADPSSWAGIVLPDADEEVAESAARVLSGEGDTGQDWLVVEDAVYEVEKNSNAERKEKAEEEFNRDIHAAELSDPDYYEGGIVICSPNEDPIELTEEEAWESEIDHLGFDPRNKDV